MKKRSAEERYWEKVIVTDGCWGWKGWKNKGGYGQLSVNLHDMGAHKFSWELHYGKIPEGMWVLHKCDNPVCSNPEHLFLGNNSDNMKDCWAKGRRKVSENSLKNLSGVQRKIIKGEW